MRILDNNDLAKINAILVEQNWLNLLSEVEVIDKGTGKGIFEVVTTKETLRFTIFLSSNFPRQGCVFFCEEVIGLKHVMQDGSICLKASPAVCLEDRLLLELEKLKIWIDKYYIGDYQDTHYEYLSYLIVCPLTVIFEESVDKPPVERDYGSFTYRDLHDLGNADTTVQSVIALNLGNRKCRWSSFYQQPSQQDYAGLWLMLDQQPVLNGRKTIVYWEDLIVLLNPQQRRALKNALQEYPDLSMLNGSILVAVGYHIPGDAGKEVHWDVIVTDGDFSKPIIWANSSNASYNRVFGRGAFDSAISEAKILIIGTGAIGSSLYTSLVRGGCRNISISDGDQIEPGNICRGDFSFVETKSSKVYALQNEGRKISPFVDVTIYSKIEPLLSVDNEYPELKSWLCGFQFIFDCSTDKYLSVMIDEMQLPGTVLNLAISYGAKEMTVVTGMGNIHLLKSSLYDRISPMKRPPFFVATGCWSPTFEASWSEINIMLHYVLTEINHQVKNQVEIRSFYVQRTLDDIGSLAYKLNYHV